jgi:hypothetical protein
LNRGFQENSPAFSSFKIRMSQNSLHATQQRSEAHSEAGTSTINTHMAPSLATVTSCWHSLSSFANLLPPFKPISLSGPIHLKSETGRRCEDSMWDDRTGRTTWRMGQQQLRCRLRGNCLSARGLLATAKFLWVVASCFRKVPP